MEDVHVPTLEQETPPPLGRIAWLEAVIPCVLLALMTAIVVVDVVMRYVLSQPLRGAAEAATTAFVWVVFLGSAAAARDRTHVRIQLLERRLGLRARAALDALVLTITVVVLGVVAWFGIESVMATGAGRRLPMLGMPLVVVFVVVPVGLLITAAHYVRDIVEDLRLFRHGDLDAIAASFDRRYGSQP